MPRGGGGGGQKKYHENIILKSKGAKKIPDRLMIYLPLGIFILFYDNDHINRYKKKIRNRCFRRKILQIN